MSEAHVVKQPHDFIFIYIISPIVTEEIRRKRKKVCKIK
ncbi:hypothetical protein NBRC111894_853 [Sporolactobacillus inulinus]|uniref:Uncharacterized protein n=1 Tax=Sporolactobacillus inulinus TaxID=2078 RepID=A0A4Y1Z8C0_9BACL|nr:hypothetical protein NBRC111894_853 [Sporolactobacillus inulinus]